MAGAIPRRILGLAVCAMPCGARSLCAISRRGRDQGREVPEALGFTRERTPCAATLHQAFSRLDRGAFEPAPGQRLMERGPESGEAPAIGGKRLRGIHGEQLPGVRLAAAGARRPGIVAGQQAVAHRRNEPEAARRLLDRLDLRGRVVPGDARFTQGEAYRSIAAKGGAASSR